MGAKKMLKKVIFLLVIFCLSDFCADAVFAARPRRRQSQQAPFMIPPPTQQPGGGRLPRRRDTARSSRNLDAGAAAVIDDISYKLEAVLEQVNAGGKLRPQDVDLATKSLRKARKLLKDVSEQEKCEYYLLSAWTNYYAGQYKKAMFDATKAAKYDPEDQDAEATRIAMALVNGQFRKIAMAAGKKNENTIFDDTASNRSKRTRSRRSSSSSAGAGILDFDPDSLQAELLGRKIAPLQLTCLNSSTISYDPETTTLCVIFWKLASNGQDEDFTRQRPMDLMAEFGAAGGGRRSKRGKRGKTRSESSLEMEIFSDLFINSFENSNVRFVAANLDAIEAKPDVMSELLENSRPWAQVMVNDHRNTGFAQFKKVDATEPVVAISGPGGTICYAGSVSGFMAPLLLDHNAATAEFLSPQESISSSNRKTAAEEDAIESEEMLYEEMSFEEIDDPNSTTTPARRKLRGRSKTAAPAARQTEDEQDEIYPEAENWYQMAVFHKESGRLPMLSNKKVSQYCRMIFQKYPESPQAERARQLLRDMPEEYRKRNKITEEEMGL